LSLSGHVVGRRRNTWNCVAKFALADWMLATRCRHRAIRNECTEARESQIPSENPADSEIGEAADLASPSSGRRQRWGRGISTDSDGEERAKEGM